MSFVRRRMPQVALGLELVHGLAWIYVMREFGPSLLGLAIMVALLVSFLLILGLTAILWERDA